GEAILRGGKEQPEIEVVRDPEVEPTAQRARTVRELTAALRLQRDRVAEDLASERGFGIGHRQHVVQPAAVPEVEAPEILIVPALGDRVVAAELLVDGGRAQQVRVPLELSRHPLPGAAEVRLRDPALPGALARG